MTAESCQRRVPPRLRPGDRLGVVAPASPFDAEIFARGLSVLEQSGFRVVVSEEAFRSEGYLAGLDPVRAATVNRMFADPSIDGIICAKGGFGSMRILPLLDWEQIRSNPKVFIGFSDITALLSALGSTCDMIVFHGPVVTSLAKAPPETRQAMLDAVATVKTVRIRPSRGVTLRSGRVSGIFHGGNLTTLCHLVGTPFQPSFRERILFLEDRGEAPYRIDRMLFQLKLSGCFEGLAGLVLGSFEDCGPLDEIYRIITAVFDDVPIPILAGIDAGHGAQNLTLPMGLEASLDADDGLLAFHGPATMER
jgi:muramoyltetrapeptide carboxypeptidase